MPLRDAFDAARTALEANPEGALPLGARKSLWRALAALSDERVAYERRVALDVACVQRVAGLWTQRFPAHELNAMLDLAFSVVSGTTTEADAERIRDRFYVDVVENREYGSDSSASFVGHAAAGTVIEALIRTTDDAMPSVYDDEALEPEGYHPSYMAASAAAGGLNGRPSNVAARRAYWRWYLAEAIREIYRV